MPMTSRPDGRARVRGAFVGAASGALSVAAHGVGGGAMMPSEAALILLLAISAAVGGAVAALGERGGWASTPATLVVGQLLGHTILTIAAEHDHGSFLTPTMASAHAFATVLCALLIRAAVRGHGHALSILRRILPALNLSIPVQEFPRAGAPEYRPDVVLRLLVCSGVGTRGPPRPA